MRRLRRARGRPGQHPLLSLQWDRLRQLLPLPGPDRQDRGGPGGDRRGGVGERDRRRRFARGPGPRLGGGVPGAGRGPLLPGASAGEPEPDSPVRTPFQRDRDRIVHSKAFRRLKHKTQVFVAPEGDHYRTRLTHTLEACGIARTVARALGLNEDLTEAIGLGHDLGHPPFGHIGEEALDAALRERCDARLQAQRPLAAGRRRARARRPGPEPDRAGPRRHPQPHRLATSRRRWRGGSCKLVDRVAYINHDIDDALRAGILRPDDLPRGGDRAARADRLEADRHAWSRDIVERSAGSRRHRPERGGRRGDAAAAQVHVRPRLPGAGGAPRARAGAADDARPLRPLHGAPRGGPAGRPGRRATASGSPTTSPG